VEAIVQDSYGSADVLELRDIGQPEIAAREVLVRVRSSSPSSSKLGRSPLSSTAPTR
jgi:NADPH:quinone reductase-like Zn-dependent oxidoreductase